MAPSIDRIRTINAATKDVYTYYPVVIVGAGESGICVGAQLQRLHKFDQFRIFDRRSGLGGTWYANKYPGIACDVPALLYSFSFAQNPHWTKLLPPGEEILRYLHDVCVKFKLHDKIQCDANIKTMKWIEEDEEWELIIEHLVVGIGDLSSVERKAIEAEKGEGSTVVRTEKVRAKIVASAAGGLVEPKPSVNVPGIDIFEGKVMHTARWDDSVELKDKNVVVVGTGCSAAQVIPQLIKPANGPGPVKHVTQLLRSPPYAPPFLSKAGQEMFGQKVGLLCRNIPGFQNALRKLFFSFLEMEWYSLFDTTEGARRRRQVAGKKVLDHMRATVPEKYHEILTPDYELFCKRRIIDDGWLQSFQDERAEITSLPLTSVGSKTVTLGPGRNYPPESRSSSQVSTAQREIPCDVLILANGYQTNEWLHPLDVTGRNNQSLSQVWKSLGGARAYMGTAMDGFPNFFLIFGPNTATGHTSVILASENMSLYSLNFIMPVLRGDARTVEIKPGAERKWTDAVQRDLRDSIYQKGGCVNWYVDQQTGWNSTTYPRSQIDFTIRCLFPRWSDWDVRWTRKGLMKLWLGRLVKLVLFVGAVVGVAAWRRLGNQGVKQQVSSLTDWVKGKVINMIVQRMQ